MSCLRRNNFSIDICSFSSSEQLREAVHAEEKELRADKNIEDFNSGGKMHLRSSDIKRCSSIQLVTRYHNVAVRSTRRTRQAVMPSQNIKALNCGITSCTTEIQLPRWQFTAAISGIEYVFICTFFLAKKGLNVSKEELIFAKRIIKLRYIFLLYLFQLLEKIKKDFFFWLPGNEDTKLKREIAPSDYAAQAQNTVGSKKLHQINQQPSNQPTNQSQSRKHRSKQKVVGQKGAQNY